MHVAGIYRPPNTPSADFTQLVINILEYTGNFRTVFADEFDIDVLNDLNGMRKYVDAFSQCNIISRISSPTCVSPSNGIATSSIDQL